MEDFWKVVLFIVGLIFFYLLIRSIDTCMKCAVPIEEKNTLNTNILGDISLPTKGSNENIQSTNSDTNTQLTLNDKDRYCSLKISCGNGKRGTWNSKREKCEC